MFQNLWYQIGRLIICLYVHLIMQADIHRRAPLPKGAKILAVNHPCTNDPAFVTILTREHATILIKETLFKVPLFGRSLRMAGHVPVVAGNGKAALDEGIRLLKAGRTVVIFPEGEISPDGGYNKPHTGVARLALATGAPVIPVGISLNQNRVRLVHTKVDGQIETGSWYLRGPYAITVGEPITFQGNQEDYEQVRAVTGQIMQRISILSQHGHLRLARRTAVQPALHPERSTFGAANPGATFQVAWRGTWQAFQQSTRLVMRSTAFRTVESILLFLLMYPKHF